MALLMLSLSALTACNEGETYAEQKEAEIDAIQNYLKSTNANIIDEATFREKLAANPTYSGKANNEWVLLTKSSVYMQVVNIGTFYDSDGKLTDKRIKAGRTVGVLCRFTETNIKTNTVTLTNLTYDALAIPENMNVTRTSDTFTGSFVSGQSTLYAYYTGTSVPTGWLVPLTYINIGRPGTEKDEIASLRLIVPHSQGHLTASNDVTPFLYDITYMEGK